MRLQGARASSRAGRAAESSPTPKAREAARPKERRLSRGTERDRRRLTAREAQRSPARRIVTSWPRRSLAARGVLPPRAWSATPTRRNLARRQDHSFPRSSRAARSGHGSVHVTLRAPQSQFLSEHPRKDTQEARRACATAPSLRVRPIDNHANAYIFRRCPNRQSRSVSLAIPTMCWRRSQRMRGVARASPSTWCKSVGTLTTGSRWRRSALAYGKFA